MPSQDTYAQYVEALSVLSSVDGLQRAALRRAVDEATTTEQRARTAMANQQRMYDRTRQEVAEAGRRLDELRAVLGMPEVTATPGSPEPGPPPSLVEIRRTINEVAQWAADSVPIAQSLLRTQARLAATSTAESREAKPAAPAARRRPWATITAVAAVLVAAVLVTILIVR